PRRAAAGPPSTAHPPPHRTANAPPGPNGRAAAAPLRNGHPGRSSVPRAAAEAARRYPTAGEETKTESGPLFLHSLDNFPLDLSEWKTRAFFLSRISAALPVS